MLSGAGTACYYSTLYSLTESLTERGSQLYLTDIQNLKGTENRVIYFRFSMSNRKALLPSFYLVYLFCHCDIIKQPLVGLPLTFVRPGQKYKYSQLSPWLSLPTLGPSPTTRNLWGTSVDPTSPLLKLHLLEALGHLGKEFNGPKYPMPRMWLKRGCGIQGVPLAQASYPVWRVRVGSGVGWGSSQLPGTGQAFSAACATRNTSACFLKNSDST